MSFHRGYSARKRWRRTVPADEEIENVHMLIDSPESLKLLTNQDYFHLAPESTPNPPKQLLEPGTPAPPSEPAVNLEPAGSVRWPSLMGVMGEAVVGTGGTGFTLSYSTLKRGK